MTNENKDDLEMLSIKEVGELLHLCPKITYKLFRSSGFPSIKIGGTYRISRKALREWQEMYEDREYYLE